MSELIEIDEITCIKNGNFNSLITLSYFNYLKETSHKTDEEIFTLLKNHIIVDNVIRTVVDKAEIYKGDVIKTDEHFKFDMFDKVCFLECDIEQWNEKSHRAAVKSRIASLSIIDTVKRFKSLYPLTVVDK